MPTSHTLYYWTASLSALAMWHGVITLLGKPVRWRWLRLLPPLLAGALSFRCLGHYKASMHPIFHDWLERVSGNNLLAGYMADVGLREEGIKLLFALPCLLWWRHRRSTDPAALTAAAVGLGFALEENRWFFAAHAEPTLLVGRLLGPTLLHLVLAGLTGAALARVLTGVRWAWPQLVATLALAAAAHGLYDWAPVSPLESLKAGGTSWLSLIIVMAAATRFFLACFQPPHPAQGNARAAAVWLLAGATAHVVAAVALTFSGWGTFPAVMVCLKECTLFLPVTLWIVLLLWKQEPHKRGALGN